MNLQDHKTIRHKNLVKYTLLSKKYQNIISLYYKLKFGNFFRLLHSLIKQITLI